MRWFTIRQFQYDKIEISGTSKSKRKKKRAQIKYPIGRFRLINVRMVFFAILSNSVWMCRRHRLRLRLDFRGFQYTNKFNSNIETAPVSSINSFNWTLNFILSFSLLFFFVVLPCFWPFTSINTDKCQLK